MVKELILRKIIDYLKLIKWDYRKAGKVIMLKCPFCNKDLMSANLIPNTSTVNCFACNKKYNLIDIVRQLEPDKKDLGEEDVLQYLKEKLKIDVTTEKEVKDVDKLLSFYEKLGFDLTPVVHNGKSPEVETAWQKNSHKNKNEWKHWLASGLNIGVKTGKLSNLTILDIDALDKKEKIELRSKEITESRRKELMKKRKENLDKVYKVLSPILGVTLIQTSLGGNHLFYQFEKDLPKTFIKIEGVNVDVENQGGQVVIAPSIVGGDYREFLNGLTPIKMPDELKKLLMSKVTVPRKTNSERIRENIKTGDFKIKPEDFKLINDNLNGCCNSSFVSLGGILRQGLNARQTEFVLETFNQHLLENPMEIKAIRAMCRELDNYIIFDQQELAHEIIEYLKDVKTSTKSDLELAISGNWTKGETKKRLNKTLQYLIKEDKITQKGKKIEIVEEMDWKDTIVDVGVPLGFKVPYFHNYAYFNKGDIIILGSQNKYGKTHLAMNVVKRLVDQGIKPYYIYSESGGRWAKIALHLGLKDRDFYRVPCTDSDKVKLKGGSITIYDWVRPNKQEGFARTDILFGNLTEKAEKAQGFLWCFVQLRDNDVFFAKDQIGQYPAFLSRYLYENPNDGTYTYFSADDVRDPKIRAKHFKIPSIYDCDSKLVKLVEELSEEEKAKVMKKLEKNAKEK